MGLLCARVEPRSPPRCEGLFARCEGRHTRHPRNSGLLRGARHQNSFTTRRNDWLLRGPVPRMRGSPGCRGPVYSPAVPCPSGRRSMSRKHVMVQAIRGFKSHRYRVEKPLLVRGFSFSLGAEQRVERPTVARLRWGAHRSRSPSPVAEEPRDTDAATMHPCQPAGAPTTMCGISPPGRPADRAVRPPDRVAHASGPDRIRWSKLRGSSAGDRGGCSPDAVGGGGRVALGLAERDVEAQGPHTGEGRGCVFASPAAVGILAEADIDRGDAGVGG